MMTTEDNAHDFRGTLADLVKGLQVIHITTLTENLLTCQHNEIAAVVFENPKLRRFDQIPVKENKKIVGLLKRDDYFVEKASLKLANS